MFIHHKMGATSFHLDLIDFRAFCDSSLEKVQRILILVQFQLIQVLLELSQSAVDKNLEK